MTILDYVVIALYGLGMIAIGRYYARGVKTADDYLLGGRRMSPLMIGLSLFATLTSTLTYLALPGEMIKNGPVVFSEMLAFPFAFLIVGWVLIPRIMRQHATSGYELLEARLGLTGRLLGAGMFVLLRVVWMATILYATTDKVLIPLLNIDPVWFPALSVGMAVVTLLYTVEGGLKAVVVTDAIQSVLMFLGAIVTIGVVTAALGGVTEWWPTSWPGHWPPAKVLPEAGASRTVVGAFMAMLVWITCTAGSDQMAIQRYLATPSAKSARRSFGIQLISNTVSIGMLGIAGLAILGYYTARPLEMNSAWAGTADGRTLTFDQVLQAHADKVMPHFVVTVLPPGVTGLVIAAILAAGMSSLSSGLNSSSAVIVRDFLGRAAGRTITSDDEIRLSRSLSVVVCVFAVAISLVVGRLATNLLELCFKVVNLPTAPIFVLFFLALFVPRANPAAAIAATVVSVSTAVVLNFGWGATWFLWATPASLVAGVIVGVLTTWLTSSRPPSAPP